jgi:lysozyme family protein
MSSFETTFSRTIGHEGKFQANPKDRGNWTSGKEGVGELKGTKWGLAAMTYPHLDIASITLEQAKEIYYNDWWLKLKMERWPNVMKYQMFDAAFNHGTGRANQFIQFAARVKDDGVIGPATIKAVNMTDPNDLVLRFLAKRLRYFTEVKTWAEFSKGWSLRVAQCLEYAAEDN